MSLLSSPQGTPERVWSLVTALAENDGPLSREEAAELLNPGFKRNGEIVDEKPTAFAQTLGAASSLGAVEADKGTLRLNPSCKVESYASFCDWVHDSLVSLDATEKDAVLLEAFAWLAVESDRQNSIDWVHQWTNDAFADAADQALPEGGDDDGDRRINKDKLPSWRRWLTSLGLAVPLPLSSQPHPLPSARLGRELRRGKFSEGEEIGVDEFLAALAARVPYLDGGRTYTQAAKRIGHVPIARQLSPILSTSLRNLDDEGSIKLIVRGDMANPMRLSPDTSHKVQAFQAVVLNSGASS